MPEHEIPPGWDGMVLQKDEEKKQYPPDHPDYRNTKLAELIFEQVLLSNPANVAKNGEEWGDYILMDDQLSEIDFSGTILENVPAEFELTDVKSLMVFIKEHVDYIQFLQDTNQTWSLGRSDIQWGNRWGFSLQEIHILDLLRNK